MCILDVALSNACVSVCSSVFVRRKVTDTRYSGHGAVVRALCQVSGL